MWWAWGTDMCLKNTNAELQIQAETKKNQNLGNNIQCALHNMVQLLERCIMSHKNYTVSSNDS